MSDTVSIISASAAVVSAVGGVIACIAAFKSAQHAKDSFNAGQLSEKRHALRQLSVTAHEVIVEAERIKWVAEGLKVAYQTLFVFANRTGSNAFEEYKIKCEKNIEEADQFINKASPFKTFNPNMLNGPLEEITVREISITQLLDQAKTKREKLEEEYKSIEEQNKTHRERALK